MIKENKQVIGVFVKLFEEVLPVIIEEGKKAMTEIADNTKEQVGDFMKKLHTETAKNVEFKEVELLNSSKLITFAKENIVPGANEVYAWKKQHKDAVYVNLAYGNDQNLLENDKNKFIIIKAEGLSEELHNMFNESELVILQ